MCGETFLVDLCVPISYSGMLGYVGRGSIITCVGEYILDMWNRVVNLDNRFVFFLSG